MNYKLRILCKFAYCLSSKKILNRETLILRLTKYTPPFYNNERELQSENVMQIECRIDKRKKKVDSSEKEGQRDRQGERGHALPH